jgi:hypothetical protein
MDLKFLFFIGLLFIADGVIAQEAVGQRQPG